MKSLITKHFHLLAVLSIAGQSLIYLLINMYLSDNSISVYSKFDDYIPFISSFVIFYGAWVPILYIAFIYLGLTNRPLYWCTIITYNVAVTISNIIFIIFPTYMPRPELAGQDVFTQLVQFIYNNDNPVNCFPSIHCLTTYLLIITMHRHKLFSLRLRMFFSIFLWGIIASTVLIKQHALIDVLSGILLAEVTYRVVYAVAEKQKKLLLARERNFSSGS